MIRAAMLSLLLAGCATTDAERARMTEAQPARRVEYPGVTFAFPATSPRPYYWDAKDTATFASLAAAMLIPTAVILGHP